MSIATTDDVRRRPGGRSARVREAVLRAAIEAILEVGATAVTMRDIAQRAGVHPSSVQRRWGTAQCVILDAALSLSEERVAIPDLGDVRDDLTALLTGVAGYLASPIGDALTRAMAAQVDEAEHATARSAFWQTRFGEARAVLDRAVDRGELRPVANPDLVLELLVAPLHFRHLLTHQPVDHEVIRRTVDHVCGRLLAESGQ